MVAKIAASPLLSNLSKFAIILLIALSACADNPNPPAAAEQPTQVLTIMAASSLTEAFTELAAAFEAVNPDIRVELNFASSTQLAQQLTSGARADVFASANQKQIDLAVENSRVKPQDVSAFATNRLVVIYPSDNPGGVSSLADLARPGVKVLLAAPEVPVGQYSLEFLGKASLTTEFGADFKEQVLANVVSYEASVKGVVVKVGLGEADAGIVYATDLTPANRAELGSISIPDELNVVAEYFIAPVADGKVGLADRWIEYLRSAEAVKIFENHGFMPASKYEV